MIVLALFPSSYAGCLKMSYPLWNIRNRVFELRRPLIMGIVNITPDSFSDGGRHDTTDAAVGHALRLIDEGADLLDLGGESTRPGSLPVSLDEELLRVLPVVEALIQRNVSVPISIDTNKAEVGRRCLQTGAHIINDVTALQGDEAMPSVVRNFGAGVILMHMKGTPATMHLAPHYDDVVSELHSFFETRLHALEQVAIQRQAVVLDPGIGFGKNDLHNLELLAHLDRFGDLGCPICLGVSRKGFLGRLLGRDVSQRLAGSLALACDAVTRGTAHILRVHDVGVTADVVRVLAELVSRRK